MRWDRFFEDLEGQLDSEWEAERAALDTEAERLRLSRIGLRERMVALATDPRPMSVHLRDGTAMNGPITRVGADWIAVAVGAGLSIVPLWSLCGVGAPADAVLASVREAREGSQLSRRMGFGFVLRDLVRRRVPADVHLRTGVLSGTIDRAGADHFDLALHEGGAPRRTANVTGYRIVPFASVVSVRVAGEVDLG